MTEVIDLVLSKGSVFVWNATDWLTLRRDHRVIGELIGCLPKLPRQEVFMGLPMLLLPEEATLLLEKSIARIVSYPHLQKPPTESLKMVFKEYRDRLFIEQEECLRKERKEQIMTMMDRIVEGKKRKLLGINTGKKKMRKPLDMEKQESLKKIEINREALFNEEMAKLPKLEKSEALVQTHTADPWLKEEDIKVVQWKYPTLSKEILRYKTYKDLWEQGYYITSGEKFGGDFLAYPGDPIMFHSQFIIQCKDRNEEMSIPELVGQCRIGCHVRKTQVFATLSENGNDLKYQSFQWAASNVS
ncbi:tRNA-splicing endonuclease subunit Sen34 [Cephus cinctus]|uniref:tRNA-splicing endonuclease subunit Sen34 n=1 Tax=Cephus cinctus TaxID=211228 RepID=A0AAJ7BN20_CEPCN|nr:tRNA-splicing endonuclease subunit Sen34 [Cephus cinctus]